MFVEDLLHKIKILPSKGAQIMNLDDLRENLMIEIYVFFVELGWVCHRICAIQHLNRLLISVSFDRILFCVGQVRALDHQCDHMANTIAILNFNFSHTVHGGCSRIFLPDEQTIQRKDNSSRLHKGRILSNISLKREEDLGIKLLIKDQIEKLVQSIDRVPWFLSSIHLFPVNY